MVFQGMAGRQLLVAMYKATHGTDFVEKIHHELEQLQGAERFIYGLVSVATAYRYTLGQDDIGIGVASNDIAWLQSLNNLSRRKLIFPHGERRFRARHRVIAQFVTDHLIEHGGLHQFVRAMLLIGATHTTVLSPLESPHARLLRTFMNHESMKRWMDVQQARTLYTEFEDALAWHHHYWLHRGALELETDNLPTAEIFLREAKALNDRDVFVDNELAYLAFKKANRSPHDGDSPGLISEAIATLNDIVLRRPDQTRHAYHIMGQQGMLWAERGISDRNEKRVFLEMLLRKAEEACAVESNDLTTSLVENLKRAILSLAITATP